MSKLKWIKNRITLLASVAFFVAGYCAMSYSKPFDDREVVTLIAGMVKPPFIIEENGKGLQLEIIREAFKLSEIEVNFVHVPLARHQSSYQKLNFDGIITMRETQELDGIHFSNPYIFYENVALSLSANKFSIEQVMDLSGKRVAAFQNATKFLGAEYQAAIAQSCHYQEFADQFKQMRNLFENKSDIVIADVNIYNYFRKIRRGGIYNKSVSVHHIFPMRGYVAGFRDKIIRDKFIKGVAKLKSNGQYLEILARYQDDKGQFSKVMH
ncbi:substrate-binding periplasmic protein [Thalassotalea atypica]|uniref:substrate-binding periplasmic protein n=1 Tax=Thalassotalea atypica TaxID=2054316 RepID=UPI00257428A4|nr:ABC transporter substrate-binding protein [Thalassotalea atypica]